MLISDSNILKYFLIFSYFISFGLMQSNSIILCNYGNSISLHSRILNLTFDGPYLTPSATCNVISDFDGPISSCRTIKIYNNTIYVVDNTQRRLHYFTMKGNYRGFWSITFPGTLFDIAWNYNQNATLLYAAMDSGGLAEYQWPSLTFSKWIISPSALFSPVGVNIDTSTGFIYVLQNRINKLTRYDSSGTKISEISTQSSPWGMFGRGNFLYVGNSQNSSLVRYDISSRTNITVSSVVTNQDTLTYITADPQSSYIYGIDSFYARIIAFEFDTMAELGVSWSGLSSPQGLTFACPSSCSECVTDQFSLSPLCYQTNQASTLVPTNPILTNLQNTTTPPSTTPPSTFEPTETETETETTISTETLNSTETVSPTPTFNSTLNQTIQETTNLPTNTTLPSETNFSTTPPSSLPPSTQSPSTFTASTEQPSTLTPSTSVPSTVPPTVLVGNCNKVNCPNSRSYCFLINNLAVCNQCRNTTDCKTGQFCSFNSTLGYNACYIDPSTSTPENVTFLSDLNTYLVNGHTQVAQMFDLSSNSSLYFFADASYNNKSDPILVADAGNTFQGNLYVSTSVLQNESYGTYKVIECKTSCNGTFNSVSVGFVQNVKNCKTWKEVPNYGTNLLTVTITPNGQKCSDEKWKTIIIIVAAVVGGCLLLALIVSYIIYSYKKRSEEKKWDLLTESIKENNK
eukprot:TRINITY_DN8547_c0_g1_i1.p1 TRINITY_DN8547_c0_g1~~TRINITY_DN8547_c0_g1_i1.p1  ORF type:complete len:687 (-),score=133.71 TRINITY_DN8547_c0_g1_i1:81-2141(-)